MKPRLMFYVQHLLGMGHLVRAQRIALALQRYFDVLLVTGGIVPPEFDFGGVPRVALTPIRTKSLQFSDLVHEDGSLFTDSDKALRKEALLNLFDSFSPEILITEMFPFGRRQVRFELLPLMERAASRGRPALVVASVRDILQPQPESNMRDTVEAVNRYFDLILVHGERAVSPLETNFPFSHFLAKPVAYTGLVSSGKDRKEAERFDVVVSAGSGSTGERLLEAALELRTRSMDSDRWLFVTGPQGSALRSAQASLSKRDEIRTFVPDLPDYFRFAKLSISQAGYNTVADVLSAGCRCALVPFSGNGEVEQTLRARALERAGRASMVLEPQLSVETLHEAARAALAMPEPEKLILEGGSKSAQLIWETYADRNGLGVKA